MWMVPNQAPSPASLAPTPRKESDKGKDAPTRREEGSTDASSASHPRTLSVTSDSCNQATFSRANAFVSPLPQAELGAPGPPSPQPHL